MRKDLPLADQLVQAAHAALEAGRKFQYNDNCHMVVLSAKNENQINHIKYLLEDNDIKYVDFYEPDSAYDDDIPMGITSLATEMLTREHRKIFKKYQLWKP